MVINSVLSTKVERLSTRHGGHLMNPVAVTHLHTEPIVANMCSLSSEFQFDLSILVIMYNIYNLEHIPNSINLYFTENATQHILTSIGFQQKPIFGPEIS